MIKLIYSISLLQKHQLCHLDIKADNIVIDDLDNIYLIDFGLTVQITNQVKQNNENEFVDSFYTLYPLFFNVVKATSIKQITDEYKDRLNGDLKLVKELVSLSGNVNKYWQTIIFPNIYKIDVYSLGKIFLYNFYMEFKDKFKKENEKLSNQLKILVMSMTLPNYKDQFDIKQCLDYIINIEEELNIVITRLSEIYITDEGKKNALNKLCKLSRDVPKDDLIVYYDVDDKIYYCLTKEELLQLRPYYINPKNPLKFIDYNFIDKIRNHYLSSGNK